ncbi:hypothetical protein C806_03181 [Lachnospiraceae bacterium 3-1]|nr:hypothetical protein C806_03181 [Lachnospiraceae bacterium 3-1]
MEEIKNLEMPEEDFDFDASAEDFLMSADVCSGHVI